MEQDRHGVSAVATAHQAAKCFDHAIKLDKHDPEGYNNRGYVEQMKRKYDKAIVYYKKAIVAPDDAVFYYNMGSCYFGKHDYDHGAASKRPSRSIPTSLCAPPRPG